MCELELFFPKGGDSLLVHRPCGALAHLLLELFVVLAHPNFEHPSTPGLNVLPILFGRVVVEDPACGVHRAFGRREGVDQLTVPFIRLFLVRILGVDRGGVEVEARRIFGVWVRLDVTHRRIDQTHQQPRDLLRRLRWRRWLR